MSGLEMFFSLHRGDLINFESNYYFLFLLTSALLYKISKKSSLLLLLISLAFYAAYSLKMLYLILLLGIANFLFGLILSHYKSKLVLISVIIANLWVLIYYKYVNFFLENLRNAGDFVTFDTLTYLVIPLGVSFFVFELIHYVVDIYRGKKAVKNPVLFLNFVFFFPTLFAGPIKRFESFIPQLRNPTTIDAYDSISLIIRGLFKKVLLADQLAKFTQLGFDATSNPVLIIIGIYAFALQIYFDFSAYTDIARGSAGFFGISIPENFLSPYLSHNLKDFWRHWHITLMEWFRDYVYIPLGGSRKGKLRQHTNVLIVFLISGLWHGAAWHFIVWGLYHGILYTLPFKIRLPKLLSIFFTFHLVAFGWIFFRATSLPRALELIKNAFQFENIKYIGDDSLLRLAFIIFIFSLYVCVPSLLRLLARYGLPISISKPIAVGFSLLLIYITISTDTTKFIYFQF